MITDPPNTVISAKQFAKKLLTWFDKHGRKNLPWQHPRTPYRVWISEIMLQQTQVTTVIPYFQRFLDRFPDPITLAKSSLDEVLAQWAGLGFYARARNLHKTAQIITAQYQGEMPDCSILLQKLPGIGRSTAGAILALGMNQPAAILDGNVKRVFTRLHAIGAYLNDTKVQKQLWALADYYLPSERAADYTQALMDLGATVCTPNQPDCKRCPLQSVCLANRDENTMAYPAVKPKKTLPVRQINLLILQHRAQILLEKRPPIGIWGGLWSLPECANEENIEKWCREHLHCLIDSYQRLTTFRHTFSHFHLDITPLLVPIKKFLSTIMESPHRIWCNSSNIEMKALPAPVKKLLHIFLCPTKNS